ncbi:MAG: PspC domain-containing protein [Rhodothermales bacterium]
MSTRTRRQRPSESDPHEAESVFAYETAYGLDDDITDDDIEEFLYSKEAEDQKPGFWNLPTAAGLSTIGVGSAYLLQELGLFSSGFDFSALVGPWLIGVLIILIGFGVLSWSPNRKKRKQKQRAQAARRRARSESSRTAAGASRREQRKERKTERRERFAERRQKFTKSRTNKKIFGVCGGIGQAFGIDPTLVRIAFVIALIAAGGTAIPIYLLLAWLMPNGDAVASDIADSDLDDDRLIIIR